MRRFRLVLEVEAPEERPGSFAGLQSYLSGLQWHQKLAAQVGPRSLERLGFPGARLVVLDLIELADEERGDDQVSEET